MNNDLNNTAEKLKQIKLTEKEKSGSFDFIMKETEKYPVRDRGLAGHQLRLGHGFQAFYKQITTPFRMGSSQFAMTPRYTMTIVLIVALLLTGGVGVAAQDDLPDSSLYSVKLATEEARGWFKLSNEAKAEWEVALASRRLEEAEKLAASGKLNTDVAVRLEEKFKAHADRVDARIDSMSEQDAHAAADLASRFEASLKAHQNILSKINTHNENSGTAKILIWVNTHSHNAVQQRTDAEAKVSAETDSQSAAEGKMKAAQHKIDEVKSDLARVDASMKAEAEAKVKLAEDTFVRGKARLEAKAYNEAFILFSEAHRTVQEAKLLIKMNAQIKLDLKSEVKINSGAASQSHGSNEVKGTTVIQLKTNQGLQLGN